jgi:SAM-dependent methyltransferase
MGTAIEQSKYWGKRAHDWAEVQEGMYTPLFAEVLRKTAAGPGTTLLDIGCGSGLFCQMATELGARVSGLDAAEPLLAIARQRSPQGDFRVGEMEELPFADQSFDLVTGFNSFQFAEDVVSALQEARRVRRKGGALVIAIFGRPEETEAVAFFKAINALLPPPPPGTPGPFALSLDGAFEKAVARAGMEPGKVEQIDTPWVYPDESTLLRGLLAPAPAARAIQQAGEAVVQAAILTALAPFRTTDGGYRLRNKTRYMVIRT